MSRRRIIIVTIGNGLILIGIVLLLILGGIVATEQYNVYAASGASSGDQPLLPTVEPAASAVGTAPPALTPSTVPDGVASSTAEPAPVPGAAVDVDRQLTNAPPVATAELGPSTITRIIIPAIKVDRKVVEMGWTVEVVDGQEVAIWDVDKYRVGHHKGTANPGLGGNIVLSGHSGGWQYPFNDIFYLKVGDLIQLTSAGQVSDYVVSEHILVDEVGQPLEKRLQNAQYIEPTDEEVVTMVACWPLSGPDKFKQRIIIRATPASGNRLPETRP